MNHRLWNAAILGLLPPVLYGLAVTSLNAQAPSKPSKPRDAAKISGPGTTEGDAGARTGRWAILVGVGTYVDDKFEDLVQNGVDVPANDVTNLAAVLRESGYDITALTAGKRDSRGEENERLKPLRANILREAGSLTSEKGIQPGDTVVFYFSGHGFAYEDKGYLAASDTHAANAAQTGVAVEEIRECLLKCPARQKVLVLDACQSGLVDFVLKSATAEGLVVMASSQGNQQSYLLEGEPGAPLRENSAYTYFLVKGLRGQADDNRDGLVLYSELHGYVLKCVTEWAERRTQSGEKLEQTPVLHAIGVKENVVVAGRLEPGTLALNATPWAEVWVDGEAKGTTPKRLEGLAPGRHVVVFRNPGHPAPIERVVVVRSNDTTKVSVPFPAKK